MENKRKSGSALVMALVFMTLLLTLAAGALAAAEFRMKSSVVARSVETGYYSAESVAQLALDLFLQAVKDGGISLRLEETEKLDGYDGVPGAIDEAGKENRLKDNIQAQFDACVRQPVEAMTIGGKSPLLERFDLIGDFEFHHADVIYENDEGEFIYSHDTYLENAGFELVVSLGGREITVRTNTETEFTAGIDYKPPTGGGGGGLVQNGGVVGGAMISNGNYVTSSGKTYADLVDEVIREVESRDDLNWAEKDALIQQRIAEIRNELLDNTVNSFHEAINRLRNEQTPFPLNDVLALYPVDNQKRLVVSAPDQLALYNAEQHNELLLRNSGHTYTLNGGDYPGLEYIYADNWANIDMTGDFENLKYINSGGVVTFLDYSRHGELEYIILRNSVRSVLAGDFESLKVLYAGGQLTFGNTETFAPFTTAGKNSPEIWVNHQFDVYFFGGKTTQILNSTIYGHNSQIYFLTRNVSRSNWAKFSSNSVIMYHDLRITLSYVEWDADYAPQFYGLFTPKFDNELQAGDSCVIRGIFSVQKNQGVTINTPADFELQGFIVGGNITLPSPAKISELEKGQLNNVPPEVINALESFSDTVGETVGGEGTLDPGEKGSAGKFEIKAANTKDMRETTGGNP